MTTQQIDTEQHLDTPPREVPSEPGDHDRMSHYADRDKIMEAMVDGTPVRAICGKVWVPTRDGMKFPICPECKEIYAGLSD